MGKKLKSLNNYISVIKPILMKTGLWLLSTLPTTFLLIVFVCPNLNTIFLVLLFFLLYFSFLAIYVQTAKDIVSKLWAIEGIKEDFCVTEIGGDRLGRFPSIGFPWSFDF